MKFKFIVTWLEDLQGFGSRANDSSLDFKRPMESSKATDADAVIFGLFCKFDVNFVEVNGFSHGKYLAESFTILEDL